MICPRREMPIRCPSSTTAQALATSAEVRPEMAGSGPGVRGLGLGAGFGGTGLGVAFGACGLTLGFGTGACDTEPVFGETCRGMSRLARTIAFRRATSRLAAVAGMRVVGTGLECSVIPR